MVSCHPCGRTSRRSLLERRGSADEPFHEPCGLCRRGDLEHRRRLRSFPSLDGERAGAIQPVRHAAPADAGGRHPMVAVAHVFRMVDGCRPAVAGVCRRSPHRARKRGRQPLRRQRLRRLLCNARPALQPRLRPRPMGRLQPLHHLRLP